MLIALAADHQLGHCLIAINIFPAVAFTVGQGVVAFHLVFQFLQGIRRGPDDLVNENGFLIDLDVRRCADNAAV